MSFRLFFRRVTKNVILIAATFINRAVPVTRGFPDKFEGVFILMRQPLGYGDLIMLSPFVFDIISRFSQPVYIVTEYTPFFSIKNCNWIHPKELTSQQLQKGLFLSPTLSWHHIKYMFLAKWYLGYFLSNRLTSNFTYIKNKYDARKAHYYSRAKVIINVIDKYKVNKANPRYPDVIIEEIEGFDLPDQYICIAPYSNWEERQYPVNYFDKVIRQLVGDYPIVLVGGGNEDEIRIGQDLTQDGVINLIGQTSLFQAVGVISKASVFIGVDSGLSHFAFLSKVPSVVIYGCVPGQLRIPLDKDLSNRITVLGAGRECSKFSCYDGFNKPECSNPEKYICLTGVRPESIVKNVEATINAEDNFASNIESFDIDTSEV